MAHPAWQEILAKIPESLHPIVEPVLKEWDQGVQQTLEAKTNELKQYEPFKQFLDNQVDPAWLAEAADFAYSFQTDPKTVIENANKAWDLGYNLDGTQQQSASNDPANLFDEDEDMQDITKHPQFAELMNTVNATREQLNEFTSRQQDQDQQQEWDNYLKKMHEEHGTFDDTYVTALVANGQNFPQALESYQNMVADYVKTNGGDDSSNQNDQAGSGKDAPVVMGGAGNAGSGIPDKPIDFGQMKSGDLEDVVEQMLAASAQQDANNS